MVAKTGWLPHPEGAVNCEWLLASVSSVLCAGGASAWKLANLLPSSSPLLGTDELSVEEPRGLNVRAPGCPHGKLRSSEWRALSHLDEAGWVDSGSESATEMPSLHYICITLSIGLCLSQQLLIWPWHNRICFLKEMFVGRKLLKGCYTPDLPHSIHLSCWKYKTWQTMKRLICANVPNDLPLRLGTHLIIIATRTQTVVITTNNSCIALSML